MAGDRPPPSPPLCPTHAHRVAPACALQKPRAFVPSGILRLAKVCVFIWSREKCNPVGIYDITL